MTPIKSVDEVDLERFMGPWYVIAAIPTPLERNIYNPVETYRLNDKGEIETEFVFRKGSFEGEEKTMRPKGFVRDGDNAHWGMQFIWPFKAEYRIIYLDSSYQHTMIGRSKRDYLWVMARTATVDPDQYAAMVNLAVELGYEREKIQVMPQRWPEDTGGQGSN